jgi:hypothetical protein
MTFISFAALMLLGVGGVVLVMYLLVRRWLWGLMNAMTTPSARETFSPRELSAAYEDYTEHGPQYVNVQTGLKATAYRFGARVLIVCEEPESGVVMLATLEEQAAAERESGE